MTAARVSLPHEVTVPPQHRVRADEQPQPVQELAWQRRQQSDEERTVLRCERHFVPAEVSLKDGDLVA